MSQPLILGNLLPDIQQAKTLPAILKNSTFVGIDFGTSTTVVSIAYIDPQTNSPTTKVLSLKQRLTDGAEMTSEKVPTVMALLEKRMLVGQGAADLKFTLKKGKNVWYSFKMELGEDLGDKYFDSELGHGNPTGQVLTKPKDAARLFFRYLKKEIGGAITKLKLPDHIQYAVSIPASFEANQRRELIEALEANGIQLSRQSLIDEPNAAFLSFVRQSEQENNPLTIPDAYNANVLVFDFGAGTCDVSILEIGQGARGLYSRNLAISEFQRLGGDDIDRFIATHYLLPQLLEKNGLKGEDFRSKELKEGVIPALLKAAEAIKIGISNSVGMQAVDRHLPSLAGSDQSFKLGITISLDTRKGVLKLHEPQLTYKEFKEVMVTFLKTDKASFWKNNTEEGDQFISIFNPIQSALQKAELETEDVDYVLFIGGSAQNPYVQDALRIYFDESELLVPQNLQSHVSQGAALHSLMYNGLNTNVIQPITSEPIILITKDATPRILIPAGEQVPTQPIQIDDLETDKEGQEAIELPICVGSTNKLLFNIRITRDGGFVKGTRVTLLLELNSDKLLFVKATAEGETVGAEPMSPFANRELDTDERIIIQAERQVNQVAAKNGGKPTKVALLTLISAYERAHRYLFAAETLEQLVEQFSEKGRYNELGILYGKAGKKNKQIEFHEAAHKIDPTSQAILFNWAYSLKNTDRKKFEELLTKAHELDPEDPEALIELGSLKKTKGEKNYEDLWRKALSHYEEKRKENKLRDFEYNWFSYVAKLLGNHQLVLEIGMNQGQNMQEDLFDGGNLTRTRSLDNSIEP